MRHYIILIILVCCLCSCRSVRYVEAPTVYTVTDTLRQAAYRIDSLLIRDSVYISGDTVYRNKTVYRSKTLTDTVYVAHTDTVKMVQQERTAAEPDSSGRWSWAVWVIAGVILIASVIKIMRK